MLISTILAVASFNAAAPETQAQARAAPSNKADGPVDGANGQTNGKTDEVDAEIVVTGSKRATSFLDSDTSVTVLSREILDQARVRDLRQVAKLVPNVRFNTNGQLSDLYISIRGVESNPYLVNRASVYVDGIPFRQLSNVVLNQVESIEVLRGPQGTLYGSNSESGLLLVSTRAPTDRTVAEFRATGTAFGSGHGGMLDGFLAGPLANDRLTGSIAFKLSSEDSYIRNLAPFDGRKGHIDQAYVQGRLRWKPTDDLTVNGMAYALNTNAPGVFEYEYVPMNLDVYNAKYSQLFNGGRKIRRFSFAQDAAKRTVKRERVAGLSATWNLGYGKLDAAGSYREERSVSRGFDLDMTATPILAGAIYDREAVWNGEVRFTSPGDKPFEYLVGASIYDETKRNALGTIVGRGGLGDYNRAPWQYNYGRDYGIFGSASYSPPFLAGLTASVGLRYDSAHRESRQTAGTLDLGPSGLIAYRDVDLDHTFHNALPRFALRYSVDPNLTIYASTARGYIPGGFNLTAVQAGIDVNSVLRYESETMWSREAGFKWRMPGGRGYLSGAVFHISSNNWQEIQVATDANGRPITSDYIGSGASIRSQGFELEATYKPVPRLSLLANFGYSDAKYRDLLVGAGENLRGNQVKLTPQYTGFGAVRYDLPSGIYVRADTSLTGRMALNERNSVFQPAVGVYGLQVGYERSGYNVRAFVENISNERMFTGLALNNLAFGKDGTFYGPIDRPRIIGVELSFHL